MTTTPTTPDVPLPAGATEVHDWRVEDGTTSRRFWGSKSDFEVEPDSFNAQNGHRCFVAVSVAGTQWADGTIKRWIEADARGLLTGQDARDLAAKLLAAAGELDALELLT
jgi:hypothetical protein